MSISRSRFDRLMSGMNSTAVKVYEAVPIAGQWSLNQVTAEMRRAGINVDPRAVFGCLGALVRAGLVVESEAGRFQREAVKAPLTKPIKSKDEPMTTNSSQQAKKSVNANVMSKLDTMDILGVLATRAANISSMVKELSSDISDAAIEIQSRIETSEADLVKFKQLQALLKGIA